MKPEKLDEADFVIVGTGAGGATAARVLAAAGHSVVMLEEGARLRTAERPRDAGGALAQAMRDGGSQVAFGSAPMPLLQGRCVGGSTAINSGIIWRMPDDVVADWTERFGLGELVDPAATDPIYDRIEDELEVTPTGTMCSAATPRPWSALRRLSACPVSPCSATRGAVAEAASVSRAAPESGGRAWTSPTCRARWRTVRACTRARGWSACSSSVDAPWASRGGVSTPARAAPAVASWCALGAA